MTFHEWLEQDEGVRKFGLQLRPEWIAAARAGWEAAMAELDAVVAAEREACALVCDGIRYKGYVPPEDGAAASYYDSAAEECADAIRARGRE